MVVRRVDRRAAASCIESREEFNALSIRGGSHLVGDWRSGLPARTPSLGVLLPPEWRERYEADRDGVAYVVVSYETPIAWVVERDGVESAVIPDVKYGPTTSRHQREARYALRGLPTVTVLEFVAA